MRSDSSSYSFFLKSHLQLQKDALLKVGRMNATKKGLDLINDCLFPLFVDIRGDFAKNSALKRSCVGYFCWEE